MPYDIIEIYNPEPHDDDQSMNDSVRSINARVDFEIDDSKSRQELISKFIINLKRNPKIIPPPNFKPAIKKS